jgi:hypothetical protein
LDDIQLLFRIIKEYPTFDLDLLCKSIGSYFDPIAATWDCRLGIEICHENSVAFPYNGLRHGLLPLMSESVRRLTPTVQSQ